MEIKTNATDRKALVQALSERLGMDAKYMGPPTFSYQIGDLTVTRDSTVTTEDEKLFCSSRCPICSNEENTLKVIKDRMAENGIALRNLLFMLSSKQYLLNRVLGGLEHFYVSQELVDALQAEECSRASDVLSTLNRFEDGIQGLAFAEGNAIFTFPDTGNPDKNLALTSVFAMMVKAAGEAKRVSPKNLIEQNEKYYLRIWLLRLGFTGKGGQDTRRALLSGLKGHTAFRTPEEAARFSARQKAKREAAKAARAAEIAESQAHALAPQQEPEAIADGKKVLFVSEKMAALQVVYNRLANVGLADFCLTLHSHKAKKKDILRDLANSINIDHTRVRDEALTQLDLLERKRNLLNKYQEELHTPTSGLNVSIYSINGKLAKLENVPDVVFSISDVDTVTTDILNERIYLLNELSKTIGKRSEDYSSNVWHDSSVKFLSNALRQEIDSNVTIAIPLMKELAEQH